MAPERTARSVAADHRCSQSGTGIGRHRPAEEVALPERASFPAEPADLGLGLDALGDDLQAQASAEAEDGLDDRGGTRVGEHAAHKAEVELEGADRQALELHERGRPGAEIVEHELDAEAADGLDLGGCPLGAMPEQGTLRDLQRKLARRQPGLVQHHADQGRETAPAKLGAGHVDRQRAGTEAMLVPGAHRLRRLTEHHLAQRHDQVGALGDGDELACRDHRAVGAAPAGKRLEARHAAVGEPDLRLEEGYDLARRQGVAQLPLEPLTPVGLTPHRRPEEAVTTAAIGLDPVERHVGVLEKLARRAATFRKDADADAGAGVQADAVRGDGQGQGGRDLAGDGSAIVGIAQPRKQHGELVAAQPGHRVAAAHAAPQPGRGLAQQRIARIVPQAVVDRLEVVEVEQQEPYQPVIAPCLGQGLLQPVMQEGTVRQAGQTIVLRQVADASLGFPPLVDVHDRAHIAQERAARVKPGCSGIEHPAPGPVGAAQPVLDVERLPAGDGRLDRWQDGTEIVRMHAGKPALVFALRPAGVGVPLPVDVGAAARGIGHPHDHRQAVHDPAQPGLARPNSVLRSPDGGNQLLPERLAREPGQRRAHEPAYKARSDEAPVNARCRARSLGGPPTGEAGGLEHVDRHLLGLLADVRDRDDLPEGAAGDGADGEQSG